MTRFSIIWWKLSKILKLGTSSGFFSTSFVSQEPASRYTLYTLFISKASKLVPGSLLSGWNSMEIKRPPITHCSSGTLIRDPVPPKWCHVTKNATLRYYSVSNLDEIEISKSWFRTVPCRQKYTVFSLDKGLRSNFSNCGAHFSVVKWCICQAMGRLYLLGGQSDYIG